MLWMKNKNFCDLHPVCFVISEKKEILKRHIKNFLDKEPLAKEKTSEKLPFVISNHSSNMIKRSPGIDLTLQENKAVNIKIACSKFNGILIKPGQVFSFWQTVGSTTKKKGYMDGRVIVGNKIKPGIGGGLCNLGNTIHRLILHSPLDVIEFHSHSDALGPDEGKRVPFSTGTSISYNNLDYRFKNNTNKTFQLVAWCEGEMLHAELRSESECPYGYRLVEEGHRFAKEGEKYYRISKIYRETFEKVTETVVEKRLVLDNHSEVMYDYSLIPKEQIQA